MCKYIKSIFFLCVFYSFQCFANESENYQTQIDNLVSEKIPGIILLVETPNSHFLGSAGLSNTKLDLPMLPDAVMPNGSAGKKLTSLLAAMLHDEGMLDLDASITQYLPTELLSKIPNSRKMTTRQLLNHTSGIFEYNDSQDYAFFKAQFSHINELKTDIFPLSFAFNQPENFKPSENWEYSNTGYALVGLILERVLNQHPSKAARKKILDPLGLNSSYSKGVEEHKPDFISGYFYNDGDTDFPSPVNEWFDTKNLMGNSAFSDAPLASSVKDIAKLLKSIVSENKIVKSSARENIIGTKNLVEAWGNKFYQSSKLYYGLGIFVEKTNGVTIYHHGGTEFGYFTQNIYIPDGDISITAFANCGVNDYCEERFQELTFKILDSFLGISKGI